MTEILSRAFDFTVERAEASDDGLTLEGYAAVFNTPAQIDSAREGRFTETIAPGAFAKTIQERMPVLQFDHGTHPMIGSIPLGVVQHLREDDNGLFVRARLSDNWLVEPVRDAISDGAVSGMSFRFAVPEGKDSWNRGRTQRTIHEAKLYELGPVVFPAYEATTVGVRSDLLTLLGDDRVRSELATILAFGEIPADSEADSFTSDEAINEPALPLVSKLPAYRMLAVRRFEQLNLILKERNA
jgi:HK97 family phage prohead protease